MKGDIVVKHNYGASLVRKDFVWPKKKDKTGTAQAIVVPSIVPFWVVRESTTRSQVNCERCSTTVVCKVGKTTYTFEIPNITNFTNIEEGGELVVDKSDDMFEEPAPKKGKVNAKDGEGKGKGSAQDGGGKTGKGKTGDGKGGRSGKGKGKGSRT